MSRQEARNKVPQYLLGGIDRYIEHGIEPGHFLQAVFENNLFEAFGRADRDAIASMFDIVSYVYNYCPENSWGNPERVKEWMKTHRKVEV